jgi:hypothetical protein
MKRSAFDIFLTNSEDSFQLLSVNNLLTVITIANFLPLIVFSLAYLRVD